MDNYRRHKTQITKTIIESIFDTGELLPKKFAMPKISYIDTAIHSAHDLIHSLWNTAPVRPLVTLGDAHTAALKTLSGILNKANPREVFPRLVPPESQQQHQITTKQT